MTTKLLQFVNEKQNMPEKRISKKRLKDFNEIYKQFDRRATRLDTKRIFKTCECNTISENICYIESVANLLTTYQLLVLKLNCIQQLLLIYQH
mgnify:CR=1 FL=1